jgi:hypothetical protein
MSPSGGYLERPAPSGLADVIEIILDKGIVIDAYARVSALGIELVTIDARIVIASVDTYLRFAEATNRLELETKAKSLPDLIGEVGGEVVEDVAAKVVEKKAAGVVDKVKAPVERVRHKAAEIKQEVVESLEPHGDGS